MIFQIDHHSRKLIAADQQGGLHEINVHIVALQGELDNFYISELQTCFQKLIEQDVKHIVIDASELHYICSRGVAILMQYCRTLQEQGGLVVVAALQPAVQRVIEVLGFGATIQTRPDLEQALQLFEE